MADRLADMRDRALARWHVERPARATVEVLEAEETDEDEDPDELSASTAQGADTSSA
ncbi:MAG TPA: hypothetical protein VEV13_06715 [Candidatus Limnocylindria bacterium]|nr:hypothetical protein [Candidatus Limnocylindria bacterium]